MIDLEIIESVADKKTIFLINKVDIEEKIDYTGLHAKGRSVLWFQPKRSRFGLNKENNLYNCPKER